MPCVGNDIVEGAWLVRYDLLFVANLSSSQCKVGLDHVVCEVFTIQGYVRIVETTNFANVIHSTWTWDVTCDKISCTMWCRVQPDVICEHLNWELALCCDLAFGWYEVVCELTCDVRSCATSIDQLIHMDSLLDKTWGRVRSRIELVKCETGWTRREVECEVEHLVKFHCLNLVENCYTCQPCKLACI